MVLTPLLIGTKTIASISKILNLGNGSTWPGHLALTVNKNFIRSVIAKNKIKIVFVVGTNGKTTTSALIESILNTKRIKVIRNKSGANLVNGIASTLILHSGFSGKIDTQFAIFEIDENTLPKALLEVTPDFIVLLNLFRDQLDRYGEVNTIALKWKSALAMLPSSTTLIVNADDPQIAYLGKKFKGDVLYFGLNDIKLQDTSNQLSTDSAYCPNCGNKLTYKTTYFSHLGDYICNQCKFRRPHLDVKYDYYPLPGVYNIYNTLAAVLTSQLIGIDAFSIKTALRKFTPAFGRQEVIDFNNKKAQLFLSKNPTSFTQSFQTIVQLGAKTIIIILNDRVPDGRDVSWIWDIELKQLSKINNIVVSGDRAFDMALRFKYELGPKAYEHKVQTFLDLKNAIAESFKLTKENETLFILPTYSAMLDVRKILTGKKIL